MLGRKGEVQLFESGLDHARRYGVTVRPCSGGSRHDDGDAKSCSILHMRHRSDPWTTEVSKCSVHGTYSLSAEGISSMIHQNNRL